MSSYDPEPCAVEGGWRRRPFAFTYKRVWYYDRSFSEGLFSPHFHPCLYELVRWIATDALDYKHFLAQVWMVGGIYRLLRHSPARARRSFPQDGSTLQNSFTFERIRDTLISWAGSGFRKEMRWIISRSGCGVTLAPWATEARTWRFIRNLVAPRTGPVVRCRLLQHAGGLPNWIGVSESRMSRQHLISSRIAYAMSRGINI